MIEISTNFHLLIYLAEGLFPVQNKKLRTLVLSAVFAAVIFVTTYFLHINTPFNNGYVHPGDAFIYLAACILPTSYAMAAASIGAAFSDLLASPIYALPTLVIKALLTLFFTAKAEKFIVKRNVIGIFLAGIAGLLGYFIFESFIYGIQPAAINAVFGAAQPIISGILFLAIGAALDKAGFKKRFHI